MFSLPTTLDFKVLSVSFFIVPLFLFCYFSHTLNNKLFLIKADCYHVHLHFFHVDDWHSNQICIKGISECNNKFIYFLYSIILNLLS